jgi:hypothetical protein
MPVYQGPTLCISLTNPRYYPHLQNVFILSLAVPLLGPLKPEGECCMFLQNVVTIYQTVKRLVSSVTPLKGPRVLHDFATSYLAFNFSCLFTIFILTEGTLL